MSPTLGGGGAERHWSRLLPALVDRGLNVEVLALHGSADSAASLASAGIQVTCANVRGGLDPPRLARAVARGLRARPDLVVSHGTQPQFAGRLIARMRRAPHVVHDHRGPGLRLRAREEWLERRLAPGADLVIGVSQAQIPDLVARGYSRDRISVIPNAVAAGEVRSDRPAAELHSELGVPGDAFLVLALASLRPEKRIDLFARAVALAHEQDPRVIGVVAGVGSETERVRAAGGDAVKLLGHRADVGDLLAAANVVCSTSDVEAQSLTVLEAMAAGRAVIATDVGGTAELIADRETGLLVPPNNPQAVAAALLELAADDDLAATLGRNAAERTRQSHSFEAMVDAYAEALAGARAAKGRPVRSLARRLPTRLQTPLATLASLPTALRVCADPGSALRLARFDAGAARGVAATEVRVRRLGGRAVALRAGSEDSAALRDTMLVRDHVPPAECEPVRHVWDLGAHIGLTVADTAAHHPGAQIVGLELDAGAAELARANTAPWADRCEIIHAAAWVADGEISYSLQPGQEQAAHVTEEGGDGALSAPALALDTLAGTHWSGVPIDFVKMNIEGAESRVLRERTGWAELVRAISVEVHPPFGADECAAALEALGFSATVNARRGYYMVSGTKLA